MGHCDKVDLRVTDIEPGLDSEKGHEISLSMESAL